MSRYDVIIVGSGPAGLAAAVNLKIRNKKFILFGNRNISDKLIKAPMVDNYLGLYHVTGKHLAEAYYQHLDKMEIQITPHTVTNIMQSGDHFMVIANNDLYESNALILAVGVQNLPAIKGEDAFLGRGVGYCATCDAPLYKNKTVAILGYNEESVHEANYVAELAAQVYFLPMSKLEKKPSPPVTILHEKPMEIIGEKQVTGLKLSGDFLKTDGVFILRDTIPPDKLLPGIRMTRQYIQVDLSMCSSIPGCFAAGDIAGPPYQYQKAAGQGQVAALSAVSYLDQLHK